MLTRAITTLAILLLAVPSTAEGESRTVHLRAICFMHAEGIRQVHAVLPGEDPQAVEIDLFTTTFSDEVKVPVIGEFIHFAIPEEETKGKTGFRIFGRARAIKGRDQLAIFVPGDSPETPYRCFIVDGSLKGFPLGSNLAINLAPVPFRFNIGEHVRDLAPGGIEKIPMARKTNDRGQVSVIISMADKSREGSWRAVNQTRWLSGGDKRELLISFIDPVRGRPTVHTYRDAPGTIRDEDEDAGSE